MSKLVSEPAAACCFVVMALQWMFWLFNDMEVRNECSENMKVTLKHVPVAQTTMYGMFFDEETTLYHIKKKSKAIVLCNTTPLTVIVMLLPLPLLKVKQ